MSKFSELILYERCRDLAQENTALTAHLSSLTAGLQHSLAANTSLAAINDDSFQRHQKVFQDFCEMRAEINLFLKTQKDAKEDNDE